MSKLKIKDEKTFLANLHRLIYDNSNALISLQIDRKCKKFIKELKECYFNNY